MDIIMMRKIDCNKDTISFHQGKFYVIIPEREFNRIILKCLNENSFKCLYDNDTIDDNIWTNGIVKYEYIDERLFLDESKNALMLKDVIMYEFENEDDAFAFLIAYEV